MFPLRETMNYKSVALCRLVTQTAIIAHITEWDRPHHEQAGVLVLFSNLVSVLHVVARARDT